MIEAVVISLLLAGDIVVFRAAVAASKKAPQPTTTVRAEFRVGLVVALFAGFPVYFLWVEPHFGLDPIWRFAFPLVIVLLFGLVALFLIRRGVQLYEPIERGNV